VSKTQTRTVVRTKTAFDEALRRVELPAVEEQVLRMRYGISADPHAPLPFVGDNDPALRAQLVALEQQAVAHLRTRVDTDRRESIIERLKQL
jgi:hypothetical protein